MTSPKILVYDLETGGVNAFNADLGYIICFGYKWLGEKTTNCLVISDYKSFKKNPHDDKELLKDSIKIMEKADGIVAHYGNRFDKKFVNSRLLKHGLPTIPKIPQLDTWLVARNNLKLSSNRLANVAKYLKCKNLKMIKEGDFWPQGWLDFLKGSVASKKTMVKYCKQDVNTLEEMALKLRPFWPQIFVNALGYNRNEHACPSCGSNRIQRRGVHLNRSCTRTRLFCTKCGHWFLGEKI